MTLTHYLAAGAFVFFVLLLCSSVLAVRCLRMWLGPHYCMRIFGRRRNQVYMAQPTTTPVVYTATSNTSNTQQSSPITPTHVSPNDAPIIVEQAKKSSEQNNESSSASTDSASNVKRKRWRPEELDPSRFIYHGPLRMPHRIPVVRVSADEGKYALVTC